MLAGIGSVIARPLAAVVVLPFAIMIVYSTMASGMARGFALLKPSLMTVCAFVTVSAAD